ncbi:hypothetical protein HPO96_03485 [Kribbella sandramycini]|uniref:Mce-associated membrane protein n=1 Tax=Kribbella sandramycini TaxID=60450 RepID=A0A7Y4KV52_9ACTN|nr:hypothetical protein [Kribbella sandramycini]MBB6568106.1 hypothetical protein [Kribbella sandramycini]NOL39300.1 hypothetical protein [Kribbella sandramycini]
MTTTTPQTSAGDAAVAAYRRYIEVTDTLARSGGTDTRDLASVADGVELAASKIQAENYRGRKVKSTGTTEVRWAKVTKLGEPAAGKVTTASVQACIDTSKTDFVDAAGKSVRRPGTPTRWLDTRDLKFVDSRWKVVHGKNRAAKC